MIANDDRLYDAQQTLVNNQRFMAIAGITRIANLTGLDRVGIPVCAAYRPESESVSVSLGKGLDTQSAYVSALMESLELFVAENHTNTVINNTTADELSGQGYDCVFDGISRDQIFTCSRHPLDWISATDLASDRNVLFPHDAVHTRYLIDAAAPSNADENYRTYPSSTNGLASGNSVDEATLHAIYEIIERDAVTLWHKTTEAERFSQCIDVSTIENTTIKRLISSFNQAGVLVRLFDVTTDVGVPVFVAVALDTRQHCNLTERAVYGSGCHLSSDIAMIRALCEASQGRLTAISGAREDLPESQYVNSGVGLSGYEAVLMSPQSTVYKQSAIDETCTHAEQIHQLINSIQQCVCANESGDKGVYRILLEHDTVQIPVVKVLIPALEKPHDDQGYCAGLRTRMARSGLSNVIKRH